MLFSWTIFYWLMLCNCSSNLSDVCWFCWSLLSTCFYLIGQDKCPGVHLIGIGEIICRIVCKAVLSVLNFDILQSSQLMCAGQDSGCKAAVHAIRELYSQPHTDPYCCFQCLAQYTALMNIRELYPPFSVSLINTYCQPFCWWRIYFIYRGHYLRWPNGDPMYALAILPLIHKLDAHAIHQILVYRWCLYKWVSAESP